MSDIKFSSTYAIRIGEAPQITIIQDVIELGLPNTHGQITVFTDDGNGNKVVSAILPSTAFIFTVTEDIIEKAKATIGHAMKDFGIGKIIH